MRKTFLSVLLLLVSCSSDRESRLDQALNTATVAENCVDPVNCDTSVPVIGTIVVNPALPEEWTPSPVPAPKHPLADIDIDGDGTSAALDCDDFNASVYPSALDVNCDGVDQNCDGADTCDADLDGLVNEIDCGAVP